MVLDVKQTSTDVKQTSTDVKRTSTDDKTDVNGCQNRCQNETIKGHKKDGPWTIEPPSNPSPPPTPHPPGVMCGGWGPFANLRLASGATPSRPSLPLARAGWLGG